MSRDRPYVVERAALLPQLASAEEHKLTSSPEVQFSCPRETGQGCWMTWPAQPGSLRTLQRELARGEWFLKARKLPPKRALRKEVLL